jgi:dihydrofolate reductase
MRKLGTFHQVTLDGYFAGPNGDISWAHQGSDDPDWIAFVVGNAQGGGLLVFGRITYELMASYWPTAQALANDPVVARQMNQLPKIVFSTSLKTASWSNTRLVRGDLAGEIRKLKAESGNDMAILGSGSIVSQLALEGLIDQYQVVVNPVAVGNGRTLFDGIERQLSLRLTTTRTFSNGKVLLRYEPGA